MSAQAPTPAVPASAPPTVSPPVGGAPIETSKPPMEQEMPKRGDKDELPKRPMVEKDGPDVRSGLMGSASEILSSFKRDCMALVGSGKSGYLNIRTISPTTWIILLIAILLGIKYFKK